MDYVSKLERLWRNEGVFLFVFLNSVWFVLVGCFTEFFCLFVSCQGISIFSFVFCFCKSNQVRVS